MWRGRWTQGVHLPSSIITDSFRSRSCSADNQCCSPWRFLLQQLMPSKPAFPAWWNLELSFTPHAELRMEQRGVTEVDVRAMLERATAFEPSVAEGRFMIHVGINGRPWIVIVEPDADASLLVVVTAY